jgi:hypothetical protein
MTPHHDRVRAVLLVHRLEAERRSSNGESDETDPVVALHDAALAELCGALGVRHSLVDQSVSSDGERLRVELELLSVLPVAPS